MVNAHFAVHLLVLAELNWVLFSVNWVFNKILWFLCILFWLLEWEIWIQFTLGHRYLQWSLWLLVDIIDINITGHLTPPNIVHLVLHVEVFHWNDLNITNLLYKNSRCKVLYFVYYWWCKQLVSQGPQWVVTYWYL